MKTLQDEYPVGTKFITDVGIFEIGEDSYHPGTNSIKLTGCYSFYCSTYELNGWIKSRLFNVIQTEVRPIK